MSLTRTPYLAGSRLPDPAADLVSLIRALNADGASETEILKLVSARRAAIIAARAAALKALIEVVK